MDFNVRQNHDYDVLTPMKNPKKNSEKNLGDIDVLAELKIAPQNTEIEKFRKDMGFKL